MARIIFGVIVILIGVSVLTGFSLFQFAFSLLLIFIGVRILTGKNRHWDGKWEDAKNISNEDFINEVAIFSPINKTVKSENFKGGKVVMVFAGGEIDLSQAKTSHKEIDMEFIAVFGGGKLIIPKDWRVSSRGAAVFGGYNNKTEKGESGVTLNLKGAAVFGGIEIVN